MAKKKRSTRRKAAARSKINWGKAKVLALPLVALLAVGGLGAGMTIGVDRLDYEARLVLVEQPLEVELNHPVNKDGVEWLPPDEYAALVEQTRRALERVDPFDCRALKQASESLTESGWFRAAPKVRRTGAHGVRIDAEWRLPAAVVRSNGRDRLISWNAMPMPMEFPIGASGAVTILGAGLAPADPGTMFIRPWPGDDVTAALKLLRLLQGEEYLQHIAALDVSGLSRNGPMVLITREETRVVWGGEPGAFRPGEVSDEVKLQRLRDVYRKYGRIDAGGEVLEINSHLPLRLPTDAAP